MFLIYSFIVQELIPVTVKGSISKTDKSKYVLELTATRYCNLKPCETQFRCLYE